MTERLSGGNMLVPGLQNNLLAAIERPKTSHTQGTGIGRFVTFCANEI